jgi:gamma-glutamyltranspeptidase/glutathione hydrolase
MYRMLLGCCAMTFILFDDGELEGAERNVPTPYKVGRSVVMAPHGIVATSHPLAAQIGLDVLKKGGNAVDAAIATNAAIGLVEPMSCGIGGDLFVIVWDNKTKKLYGLNANGRVPYAATREFFAKKGMKEIPTFGPLSWSVPGCVDGWEELRKRFGTMSFEQLLGPSIQYAEEGFPVTEVIAGYWRGGEKRLRAHQESSKVYLVESEDGRPRAPPPTAPQDRRDQVVPAGAAGRARQDPTCSPPAR